MKPGTSYRTGCFDDLLKALKETRAELFLKISNQHGPKFASEYPEIILSDAAIKKATGAE